MCGPPYATYMMASASLPAWKEFDEALIESVRKYPCLYDFTLKEFKQNDPKNRAWVKVAESLESEGMHTQLAMYEAG